MSYQGFLTDRFGSPINDTLEIEFSIYAVPAGGVPLWSDLQTVGLFQGLFSVELGGEFSPFPADLFETPLYLGIKVGDDVEMVPRRPLTAVAFSFRAEDADALQGRTAAELDQSERVAATGNPHAVTVEEVGAITEPALSAHTGDTGNPHIVTAAQAGAVDSGIFGLHSVNASAHHARYDDAEAVGAMGSMDQGNPLNHDRYTNAEATAAILAADGPGSSLDADTLDGVELSAVEGDIVANTVAIAANSNAIADLGTGAIKVFVGQQVLGALAGYESELSHNQPDSVLSYAERLWVLSSENYLFRVETYPDAPIPQDLGKVYFESASPDCSGVAVLDSVDLRVFGGRQGVVVTRGPSGDPDSYWYVPAGSSEITITAQSRRDELGNCSGSSGEITGFPVFQNDQVVTGVPSAPYSGYVTIGH